MPGPFKLGAKPSRPESLRRTLKLGHYLSLSQLTEFVPPEFDWFQGVPDSVDLNNDLGICTVAAMAKMERSWTQNAKGTATIVTDSDLLSVYMSGAGYDPTNPDSDQGWYMDEALTYWQRTGIAGHKIGAYAAINPRHHHMMRAAAYLFGGLYLAFDLPESIWTQSTWDVVANDGGPAGGHCVTGQAILDDQLVVRTWGYAQPVTWRFVDKYCSECYAIIAPEYLNGSKTIAGLDAAALKSDLAIVKS